MVIVKQFKTYNKVLFFKNSVASFFCKIFKKNIVLNIFVCIVKFYYNIWFDSSSTLKFQPIIPLEEKEDEKYISDIKTR